MLVFKLTFTQRVHTGLTVRLWFSPNSATCASTTGPPAAASPLRRRGCGAGRARGVRSTAAARQSQRRPVKRRRAPAATYLLARMPTAHAPTAAPTDSRARADKGNHTTWPGPCAPLLPTVTAGTRTRRAKEAYVTDTRAPAGPTKDARGSHPRAPRDAALLHALNRAAAAALGGGHVGTSAPRLERRAAVRCGTRFRRRQYSQVPPSTREYSQVPPSTREYSQVPPSTREYSQVPPSTR
jgi:hypothetical protein